MKELKEEMRFKSYIIREKLKPITHANQLTRAEAKIILVDIKEEAITYFSPYIHYMVNGLLGLPVSMGYGNLRDDFKEFADDIVLIRQILITNI